MNRNIVRLREIAKLLGDIKNDVVFVGGATVGLYIDDLAAPTPQPSEDIDCVVEIATYGDWCLFEERLRKKGFKDVDSSGEDSNPPSCRKFILGMKVDFMPVEESVLGYGNPWFRQGLEKSILVSLDDIEISIFTLENFVATKLMAFSDRGGADDIRFSQDLEDLTELIDGASGFSDAVSNANEKTKQFIVREFKKMLKLKDEHQETMYGFLGYDDLATKRKRVDRIFEIIEKVCAEL